MKIKPRQIPAYDAAARELNKAAEIIEGINIADINKDAMDALYDVCMRVRALRAQMFNAAHAAFLRARAGES